MPVQSLLISGPQGSGKSLMAGLIAQRVLDHPPHYLRLVPASDRHTNAILAFSAHDRLSLGSHWASRHRVSFTLDRLFEIVPEGLRAVRRLERTALAVIEADADPPIRHAYPYDYRVFVMGAPADVYTVFRTPDAAAAALQQVLQDTAAFASEIFGLFEDDALDDALGVEHFMPTAPDVRGQRVERLHVAEAQIRHFLSSPLGAEIASRIQLQPDYHALVEADFVIINARRGEPRDVLDECVSRLQKLLTRIRQDARRQSVLYWGDLADDHDHSRARLLDRMKAMFVEA